MVLDYRNTRFSFSRLRRQRRRRRLGLAAALILLTAVTLLVIRTVQYRSVKRIQADLLSGEISAAMLDEESRPLFTTTARGELRSLHKLLTGDMETGKRNLESGGHSGLVDSRRFLDRMVDLGRYEALGIYLDFLDEHNASSPYHRVLYHTARYRSGDARRLAAQLPGRERSRYAKALQILEETWNQLDKGPVACIHDRNGRTIGEYDPATGTVNSRITGLDLSSFSMVLRRGLRFFTLTLDAEMQESIHTLFSRFHGSCVILNPAEGAILAAYSKPVSPGKGNTAWTREYEAGSIIKTLTYLAFLKSPEPGLFPLECRGNIQLNRRIFYDWKQHGAMDSPETALAVSCNIAFARMGIAVGADAMDAILRSFLFNRAGLKDRHLDFHLGTFTPPPLESRRLADLSVGLTEIRVTTLHAALLAAAISQSGSMPSPHLITTEKNILRLGIHHHAPAVLTRIPGDRNFIKLREAMIRVIRDPRGTGRRARDPEGPVIAVKTGTAGDPRKGLDAIMMGFLPARRPLYAFAFRLEHGGKAELNGARLLKALAAGPLSSPE